MIRKMADLVGDIIRESSSSLGVGLEVLRDIRSDSQRN